MANYKVNPTTKTITVEVGSLTENEMKIVQFHLAAGYILKEKKKGTTYEEMRKALKDHEEALAELEKKIKAQENYMHIKKWYELELMKIGLKDDKAALDELANKIAGKEKLKDIKAWYKALKKQKK